MGGILNGDHDGREQVGGPGGEQALPTRVLRLLAPIDSSPTTTAGHRGQCFQRRSYSAYPVRRIQESEY